MTDSQQVNDFYAVLFCCFWMEVSVLQQIAKTAWCMILNRPRGIALVYCPSICWRRCLAFLAQVWKKGCNLRQRSAREAISWRRSPAENHTCAMDRHHLRHGPPPPAPWTAITCARNHRHLHPEPPSPAPGTTVTCARNYRHLRRKQLPQEADEGFFDEVAGGGEDDADVGVVAAGDAEGDMAGEGTDGP